MSRELLRLENAPVRVDLFGNFFQHAQQLRDQIVQPVPGGSMQVLTRSTRYCLGFWVPPRVCQIDPPTAAAGPDFPTCAGWIYMQELTRSTGRCLAFWVPPRVCQIDPPNQKKISSPTYLDTPEIVSLSLVARCVHHE